MKLCSVSRFLPVLFLIIAPIVHAESLNFSAVGLFPKNVSEFGYADLSQAREFAWFPQFEAQLVPVSLYGFEQFLGTAQMKQTPSIDQVAWAKLLPAHADTENAADGNGQIVGIALGHFDTDTIESFLTSRNISGLQIGNDTVYGAGTGSGNSDEYFTMIDSETIAFGPLNALKRMLSVRGGQGESLLENDELMELFNQANGDGIFWGVLGASGARSAIGDLVPEASKFPQARDVIGKMKHILVSVKAPSDIELDLHLTAASANDAILLSQFLQAGLLYRQYQAGQDKTGLADILNGIHILPNGNQLELSFNLTNDQVLNLIEHNAFIGPM